MNDEILGLIQLEVDQANTPQDSARLASLCSTDPTIQTELDQLFAVAKMVEGIAPRSPSAAFTNNVMASLPTNPAWLPKPQRTPIWTRLFSLPSRPAFVLSYGLVIGAFVMFALTIGLQPDQQDTPQSAASATMAPLSSPIFSDTIPSPDGEMISIEAVGSENSILFDIAGTFDPNVKISIKIEDEAGVQFDRTIPFVKK